MEYWYVLFGILISHLGEREGSWLLPISVNSNMQTPGRNAVMQMQDWKQHITILLAKCQVNVIKNSTIPGEGQTWMTEMMNET